MGNSKEDSPDKPGETGQPLDGEDDVIRMGLNPQSDYDSIAPNQFSLSSRERKKEWQRLSVWEDSLTSVEEIESMLSDPDKKKIVMTLNVGEIRSICHQDISPLDVKWDKLDSCIDEDNNKLPDYEPGCEGHCGLDGVDEGNSGFRKKIRKELVTLAMSGDWDVV